MRELYRIKVEIARALSTSLRNIFHRLGKSAHAIVNLFGREGAKRANAKIARRRRPGKKASPSAIQISFRRCVTHRRRHHACGQSQRNKNPPSGRVALAPGSRINCGEARL